MSTPGVVNNGKSKASIGTAKIDAGQTEIVVETTAVKFVGANATQAPKGIDKY